MQAQAQANAQAQQAAAQAEIQKNQAKAQQDMQLESMRAETKIAHLKEEVRLKKELMQFEFFPAIIIISMLSEMNMGMAARKNHSEKAIPTPSVVEKKRRQVNLKFHEGLGVSA